MKKFFLVGLAIAFFTTIASAQQAPGEKLRRHKIAHGYHKGELTRHEMRKLHRTHRFYKHEARKALRDGKITPKERQHLAKIKKHENRKIFRYKHNNRKRIS